MQKFAVTCTNLRRYFSVAANHVASHSGAISYVTRDVMHAKAKLQKQLAHAPPIFLQGICGGAASFSKFLQHFLSFYFTRAKGLSLGTRTTPQQCGDAARRRLIGSHVLRVDRNHLRAAPMTGSPRSRVLISFHFGPPQLNGDSAFGFSFLVLRGSKR